MSKHTPRLKTKYNTEIKAKLQQELGLKNINQVPTLTKIVVNAGIGKEYRTNTKVVDELSQDIAIITGQKPVVTQSKKAVSNFKLRENMDNGIMVTIRGDRMWDFYDRLVSVTLPRVKDFRGVSRKAFDCKGNYAVGIKEHTVFPEIDSSKLVKIRSLQVIICTSADNNEQGLALLKELGMPFREK
jgi:large subunit ribosomal protein L5